MPGPKDSSNTPENLSHGNTLSSSPKEVEETLISPPAEFGDKVKVPEMLGSYQIVGEIGKGGMGRVYKAYHPQLERTVAIKVMLSGGGVGSTERDRFLTEARLAARLKHPNIVTIHDVNSQEGLDYLVMEYVVGESLESLLKRERLPLPRSLQIARDVARAIDYAHHNQVIHRDLKPSNLILESSGNPIIMDFGLAKSFQDSVNLTQSGQILGTPRYMSPEQASGEKVSHLTDIYSLGVILYEMLTGVCPVSGDTLVSIIYSIVHRPVVPLRKHNADIPQEVENICLKAMEKSPDRRYRNAGELAGAIDEFILHQAGTVGSGTSTTREPSGDTAVPKSRPILRKVSAVAAVAVLFLIAVYLGTRVFKEPVQGPIADNTAPTPAQPPEIGKSEGEKKPPETEQANDYFERANLFVQQRNLQAALASYNDAIRLNPKFSEAYRMRGRLYHMQGDLKSALADYDRAVASDPNNHWAYHDRGLIYLDRGELDRAIAEYDLALRANPNFIDGYNNRAICFSQKKEMEKAISDMGVAIKLSPNDPQLYYNRGYFLKAQGRDREAARDFHEYLRLVPNSPKAAELRKYIDDHSH